MRRTLRRIYYHFHLNSCEWCPRAVQHDAISLAISTGYWVILSNDDSLMHFIVSSQRQLMTFIIIRHFIKGNFLSFQIWNVIEVYDVRCSIKFNSEIYFLFISLSFSVSIDWAKEKSHEFSPSIFNSPQVLTFLFILTLQIREKASKQASFIHVTAEKKVLNSFE